MLDWKSKLRSSVLALGALSILIAGPGASATLLGDYEVGTGVIIEACGGFAGTCRFYSLAGTLRLWVDFDAGQAAILQSDLQLVSMERATHPFPNPTDLQPTDFVGSVVDAQRIRFEHPAGSTQQVSWELTLDDGAFVLDGTYDEGCCDRFIYSFNNVTFQDLPGAPQLLLNGDRFAVAVSWADSAGAEGAGIPVELTEDSGYFWFFDPDNVELVVKVLDACQEPYHHFWFFTAGLTNVEVMLRVTDLETGTERTYFNPVGAEFQPILDTRAFATCDGK